MRILSIIHCAVVVCLCAGPARAENIELFRASRAGPDVWHSGEATIKYRDREFIITENKADANYGDVYIDKQLPYFPNGTVEVEISEIMWGSFTIQVLGFKNGTHIDTAEPIANSGETGGQVFTMGASGLSPNIDTILFKVWVSGDEGAHIRLADLSYSLAVGEDEILHEERFKDKSGWQQEGAFTSPSADGIYLGLRPGSENGSIVSRDRFNRQDDALFLLDLPQVRNGRVSVQFVQFDGVGTYLDSINVLQHLGAGVHGVRLASLPWHSEARQFEVKIWVAGQPGARAAIRRFMLIKP